jgi:hypothetical protein
MMQARGKETALQPNKETPADQKGAGATENLLTPKTPYKFRPTQLPYPNAQDLLASRTTWALLKIRKERTRPGRSQLQSI